MNYLVLVRHGESQWNKENRFTGWTDVDLSETGVAEAQKGGKAIKSAGIAFDAAFTSGLKRANRTLDIVLENAGQNDLSVKAIRHKDLNERDYGQLTGLNKDETRAKYGDEQVHIWRRSYDIQPPGGESLKDVVENRVRPYFNAHIKPLVDQGKNVIVAAHGNSLRAMLIILGENTPENINEAEMPTGVPLVFEFKDGKRQRKYFLDGTAPKA